MAGIIDAWRAKASDDEFGEEGERNAMNSPFTTPTADSTEVIVPYWAYWMLVEEAAKKKCRNPNGCSGSSLCITEYCVGCYARSALAQVKK